MRSILMLVMNNIKRKKLVNGLIFFIIFLGALMFASALNIMNAIKEPFKENHKALNGFHLCIAVDGDLDKEDKVLKLVKEQAGIQETSKNYSYCINSNLFIQELEDANQQIDKVKIVEGVEKKSPDDGEIWISTKYAKQKKLVVGDRVSFTIEEKEKEFIVSAIVIESAFSSPMNSETRGFVKKGYIEENIKNGFRKTINIRFKDESKINGNTETILNNIYGQYSNLIKSRCALKNIEKGYNSIFNVIGGVLIAISLVVIIFVIVVIYFTISEMILSDFKTIGILETIGFSKVDVLSSYILQFVLITILAIPIGIIGSYYGVKYILKDIFYTYGFFSINLRIGKVTIITFIIIISIIFIGTCISSIKAMKVNVVEAISKGEVIKNNGSNIFTLNRFKRMPICLMLTLKNIFWRWREGVLLFIIIFIGTLGVITTLNIRNSFNNLYKNPRDLGLENSSITIKSKDNVDKEKVDQALTEIRSNEDVKNMVDFYLYTGLVIDKTEKLAIKVNPSFYVYNGNMDEIGLINLEGRHVKNKYEIELAIEMAKNYGKGIGDYITFIINNEKKDFLIVGLFDTLFDPHISLRTSYEFFKEIDPKIDSKIYKYHSSVEIKDKNKIGEIVESINKKYGDLVEVTEGNFYIKDNLKETVKIVAPITLILTFSFMILSVICVFNFIVINIYNEKKTLGIYSVLGVETRDLVAIAFNKIAMFYLVSVIMVLPIAKTIDEYIMVCILKEFGVRSFTIIPDWKLNCMFLGIIGVLYVISALVSSKVVLSIDEKILISD